LLNYNIQVCRGYHVNFFHKGTKDYCGVPISRMHELRTMSTLKEALSLKHYLLLFFIAPILWMLLAGSLVHAEIGLSIIAALVVTPLVNRTHRPASQRILMRA
jgi:hypothetical protein